MLPAKRILIRILVIGIALMLGLLITVFLKFKEVSENPAKLMDALPKGADIALGEIRHTSVKDGRKEWSLEASSANYSNSAKEALFNDVQVTFFLESDREVVVKGRQGRLKTDTNDIEISGAVSVRDAEYEIDAEQMTYDHVHRKIDIPVPVKITGRTFELHADRMTVDLQAETALLRGTVNGRFHGNDAPLL